jgi:hypothetical protein
LQIEHIQPRAKGGTNRTSNLCLACEPCNIAKGTQDIAVFLKKKADVLTRQPKRFKASIIVSARCCITQMAIVIHKEAHSYPCMNAGVSVRLKLDERKPPGSSKNLQ